METREWRSVDKSSWPEGPWKAEPDKMQWVDEETGLPCLIVRNHGGALCGYVGVVPGHPLHGVSYNDEVAGLGDWLERRQQQPVGPNPGFAILIATLTGEVKASPEIVFEVHGGLTFSEGCHPHTIETWDTWRKRIRGGAAEAKRFPQGDAAQALREAGAALDDYDTFVEHALARWICHVPSAGEPDAVWWFGFDCAHSGDASPAYASLLGRTLRSSEVYRDVAYVKEEIAKLASQLAAVRSA